MKYEPSAGGTGPQRDGPDERSDAAVIADLRHGMANSLQMLAALVQVRITAVEDPATRRELEALVSRVHGMGMVYRALDVSTGRLRTAVHRVVQDLCGVHRAALESANMQLRCHTDEILIPLDAAMPLAVLTSEILMAAIKRCQRARHGALDILLVRDDDGRLRLDVLNDGFDLPQHSGQAAGDLLGWTVVTALARQIGASVERSADDRRITLILRPSRLE